MSATNATTNYELPVFIATDKPAWLVDWNGAMNAIDSAIKEAKTAGDNAQSTANTNANNIQTLDGTVSSQGTAIGNLQTAVSGNTGSINTINSLIGNGEPTTTDKTIIGAINEINAKVGDAIEADDVTFDPTGTSLVATNVEDAIKEVASGVGVTVEADDVTYVNTTSGLTATNVQDAIDELASAGPSGTDHGIYELWANADPTQSFGAQNIVINDYDTSVYDAIWIMYENDKDESMGAIVCEVDDVKITASSPHNTVEPQYMELSTSSGKLYCATRDFTFSLSGTTLTIAVAQATRYTLNSYGSAATSSASDDFIIPVRILGLRHNS